jgi:hypothetical protein
LKRKHYRKMRIGEKTYQVHRIVMQDYLGRELDPDEFVHHCNGDIHDNRVENLELMSRAEHGRHHHPAGRKLKEETKQKLSAWMKTRVGELCPSSKLTEEQVRHVHLLLKTGHKVRHIALNLGVHHSVISDIKTGKQWKHVPREFTGPGQWLRLI